MHADLPNVCFSKCLRGTTATSTQGIKHSFSITEKKGEMYLFLHFFWNELAKDWASVCDLLYYAAIIWWIACQNNAELKKFLLQKL